MAPGGRSKFGAPMLEPEVFRKQIHLKKILVTSLGLFGVPAMVRRPHSDSAPGELFPPCPLATPLYATDNVNTRVPQRV